MHQSRTSRSLVKGNKLVRKAKSNGSSGEEKGLTMGEATTDGSWYLLLDREVIKRPIFSLIVINGEAGVLSIGRTAARAIEMVVNQTETELDRFGGKGDVEKPKARKEKELPPLVKRGRAGKGTVNRQADWEEGWAWNGVQGADGWWQLLMRGVWIDGSRVLRNQAVVVDINGPFIIAPPLAAKAFNASVSGSRLLAPPFSNLYVFPCLNSLKLHFEFSGTMFPFMQGGRGAE
ncbi:hypothetical protein OEA41_007921 [Lepraria neglecta]|uniref:Uncharacterized protein n=1 Tax=Lepraria neglecta TaxID=209136 RepID=A0AAD9ZDN3_9LECA|nr:hypothetical protein OEA41_007921 [Lepraria neglecta]